MTSITKKDILEILKELIINHDNGRLGTHYSDINLHSTLIGDLGFDSMDVAELTMAIESKLKIRIEDEEVEKIRLEREKRIEKAKKELAKRKNDD